jgi:hypothetical protein
VTGLHPDRPPDVPGLLAVLEEHEVVFVLGGSVAAMAYGVALQPGDLDIVPDPDPANLKRLVRVIRTVEGRPAGPFGSWETQPDGERKWIARSTTPQEAAGWTPDPGDIASLDHLLRTRNGNLDIVPEILGTYAHLKERAVRLDAFGCTVWVAHVDDLLARLTVPRREKDVTRVQALRAVQRARGVEERRQS